MEEKDYEIVGLLLSGFSFKQIQLGRDVWQTAEVGGVSLEELKDYIQTKIDKDIAGRQEMLEMAAKQKEEVEKLLPRCPECGSAFYVRSITIPEGPGNLYGYKSHWFCSSCIYEEYSVDEFPELTERIKKILVG